MEEAKKVDTPSIYMKCRSLAFFDALDGNPKISMVLVSDEPIAIEKLAHFYIEMGYEQMLLMMRESAYYVSKEAERAKGEK